jgi:effector-binding domain-containing protein
MTWIDTKGYQICGPSRELYLHMGSTPDSHMTEIQIPVQRR